MIDFQRISQHWFYLKICKCAFLKKEFIAISCTISAENIETAKGNVPVIIIRSDSLKYRAEVCELLEVMKYCSICLEIGPRRTRPTRC